MCLRIYLNGDGTGRGTHLSLFFVVMKGPNDALLRWPFNQKVCEPVPRALWGPWDHVPARGPLSLSTVAVSSAPRLLSVSDAASPRLHSHWGLAVGNAASEFVSKEGVQLWGPGLRCEQALCKPESTSGSGIEGSGPRTARNRPVRGCHWRPSALQCRDPRCSASSVRWTPLHSADVLRSQVSVTENAEMGTFTRGAGAWGSRAGLGSLLPRPGHCPPR